MADVLTGFQLNFLTTFKIGKKGTVGTDGIVTAPTKLYKIEAGIETAEPKNDEETKEYIYYKNKGGKDTAVTGVNIGYSFKGNRTYGNDNAQNFIRDILTKTGEERVVYFEVTEPDGTKLSGNATVSGITQGGGDANERGTFEFEVTFNGTPTDTYQFVELTEVTK